MIICPILIVKAFACNFDKTLVREYSLIINTIDFNQKYN